VAVLAVVLAAGMAAGPAVLKCASVQESPQQSYTSDERRSMATQVREDIGLRLATEAALDTVKPRM